MTSLGQGTSAALRKGGVISNLMMLLASTTALSLVAPATASAQDAPASSANMLFIEEVIVSARKRDENLQQVPDAVSVFTASTIERSGINNIQDFAAFTPNLVIIDQLRPGIQTISLRGMTTVQGGQAPFAMIVDGVQQPSMDFLNQELVDIERIEVLRGPQGTLYGGGAIGGAINVVTKRPGDEFEVSGKVYWGEGNTFDGLATLSGPIVDNVQFRTSVFYTNSDGVIRNTGTDGNVDFRDEIVWRGALYIQPTENIDVELRAAYTDGEHGAMTLVPVTTAQFDDFSILPATNIEGVDKRKIQSYSAKVEVDLDAFTLTSITGYNDADQVLFGDGDYSIAPTFAQDWRTDSRAVNQEFRLSYDDSGAFRWLVGAFYQDRKISDYTAFGNETAAGGLDLNGATLVHNVMKSKSWALFGQASYDITHAVELTLGLRYDRDKQSVVDLYTPDSYVKHPFKELQPKVSLSYQVTDDLMTYATYARGFRTGGFNPISQFAGRVYENEVADNFELGVKSEFFGGRVMVNAAAFHIAFDNQQFFFSRATDHGIFRNIVNIPKTEINGVEVEVAARPFDNLLLRGSLGYNDTEIKNFDGSTLFKGNRTPQVNDITASISADFNYPIADGMDLIAHANYERRGSVYWDIENTLETPGKDFVNIRVGVETDNWTLALVGRNITNERTPGAVGADAFGPGLHLRGPNRTRTWGGEVRFRF